MVEELCTLQNTLTSYKKSIVKNLDKIDEYLSQEFDDYGDQSSKALVARKFTIAENMMAVLQSYTKILFLSEKAVQELVTKLDHNQPPEKDISRRNSNPFHITSFASVLRTPESVLTKTEIQNLIEDKSSPSHPEEPAMESRAVFPIAGQQEKEVAQVEKVEVAITNVKIEEETNLEMTPVRELTVDWNVDTKVGQVPVLETSKLVQPPHEPKYKALVKLLNMTVHNRKKETEKRYEKKHLQEDYKLKRIPKTPGSPERRIKVPKSPVFEIKDDVLAVQQYCIFSHIATLKEFYIRTNQELFESLENSLNEDLNSQYQYVIGNYKSKREARAVVGNFCFVFLADRRKWFRVHVIDWMETKVEHILVQLIDYGEKCLCRYENLKRMTELYAEFPKMAIRCHFAGISPPDHNDMHISWPQGSIDAFIELSEIKQKTKFLIIYVHKEGDSYGIDLIKEKSDQSLARSLIHSELGVYEEVSGDRLGDLNEIIDGCEGEAQDEARIYQLTDDSGKCFKRPLYELEYSKLTPDRVTTDKALIVTQALNELQLPSVGEYIKIVITGYINTCHFYAHIIRKRANLNLYNDDFHKLMESINSNNIVHTYEPLKLYPSVGEVILAKHGHQWYRAICVKRVGNKINVFLVDFGLRFTKKMADLRQIKEDLLYLPFQAVECMLDSCCEKTGVSLTQSEEFYESCMRFKNFKAYVMSANTPLRLRMYDEKNFDMDFVLKEYGLGQDRDNNLFPN